MTNDLNKVRLDEWACVYDAPTSVPFELKPTGGVFRGMRDLEKAKEYAKVVAKFFSDNNVHKPVYVVRGPTTTTKAPFEVVDACCGYTVAFAVEM